MKPPASPWDQTARRVAGGPGPVACPSRHSRLHRRTPKTEEAAGSGRKSSGRA